MPNFINSPKLDNVKNGQCANCIISVETFAAPQRHSGIDQDTVANLIHHCTTSVTALASCKESWKCIILPRSRFYSMTCAANNVLKY